MRSNIPRIGDTVEIFDNEGKLNSYYKSDVGIQSEVLSVFLNKNGYLMVVLEQPDGNCACVMAHYVRAASSK